MIESVLEIWSIFLDFSIQIKNIQTGDIILSGIDMKRILLLAANPVTTVPLQLEAEFREIKTAIRSSLHRDQLDLRKEGAIRPKDLASVVPEYKPHVIHFSGHGAGQQGLFLEDDDGQTRLIDAANLGRLFKLVANQVECVVLNACFSEVQAEIIRQHINYVVGMNDAIGDRTATDFSVGFYNALGAGESYENAYEFGCFAIAGTQQEHIPVLKKKVSLQDSTVNLWVHGWNKQSYGGFPHVELNWTLYFNINTQPRQIADHETWNNILFPQLLKVREELSQTPMGVTINLRGLLPLTVAIAIGTIFPDTRRYSFQLEQRTTGRDSLWRSDTTPSALRFQVIDERGTEGANLLVALSITGSSQREIAQLFENSQFGFSAMIYVEPNQGTGERALGSDADAVALAIHAKELIRCFREKYAANCIHLVVYGPQSFCVFLGHRLRVVGEVVCYERVASGHHLPSVLLQTG